MWTEAVVFEKYKIKGFDICIHYKLDESHVVVDVPFECIEDYYESSHGVEKLFKEHKKDIIEKLAVTLAERASQTEVPSSLKLTSSCFKTVMRD